jgi:hypothetical protein
MRVHRILHLASLSILLCCAEPLRGESITVWGGDSSIGGYGDLATNLLMAQNLKRLLPNSKITLVVPKQTTSIEMFSHLGVVPGSTLSSGIRVELENAHPAPSDFLLSFSEQQLPPEALRLAAGQRFSFLEYGDRTRSRPSATVWGTTSERFGQMAGQNGEKPFFGGSAGPSPKALGLYTTPQTPPTNAQAIAQFKIGPGTRVGFAYSHEQDINHRYLKGIAQFAEKAGASQKVLEFTNHAPPAGMRLPKNLEVIVAPNVAFETTQALMARADLPVLVTGDVSLTLALQYGKVPIYETLEHKIDLARDMRRQLVEQNPRLAKPEFDQLLAICFPDLVDVNKWNSDVMDQIISNEAFRKEIQSAIEALKQKSSLPVFVAQMISHWENADRDVLIARALPAVDGTREQTRFLWQKSDDEIVNHLVSTKNKTELTAALEELSRWRTKGDIEDIVEAFLTRQPYGSKGLPTKIKTCRDSFARLGRKVHVPNIY